MTDRPIIFSAPMVRALLAGTKTQTRRVLKPQPPEGYRYTGIHYASYEPSSWFFNGPHSGFKVRQVYEEGDQLWVREGWRAPAMNDHLSPRDMPPGLARRYLADDAEVVGVGARVARQPIGAAGRTRPGIHMPRWASRLTLDVTEVRVERLQDISDDDCFAEGLEKLDVTLGRNGEVVPLKQPMAANEWPQGEGGENGYAQDGWDWPQAVYADLWESLHGRGSWKVNPWVAAISFRVILANIDSLPEQQAGGLA